MQRGIDLLSKSHTVEFVQDGLVQLFGIAEARKRAVSAEARRVAAKIATERKTWRGLYQTLARKQQNKLDWELRRLVIYSDQIKIGGFFAESFGVYLRGEDTVFHITVVTDGSIEGIEQLGL